MTKVIVPRGIPGSGKTTWVKDQISQLPAGTAVRINNDDLASSIWGRPWGDFFFSDTTRDVLRALRIEMLDTFLKQPAITHVFIDNTNLATYTVRDMHKVAVRHGAEFIVDDQFLAVPIEDCIARDALRDKPVGADVIHKMARGIHKLTPWVNPTVPTVEVYRNDSTLDSCIIVDIDGTLAHMDGRDPYDYSRVHTDIPDTMVPKVVRQLDKSHKVIIMSGRDDNCMDVTVDWLRSNDIPFDEIYMRTTGDVRPDWIIKNELFQQHVADQYHVALVIDDRDQVIDLWRNKLGLKTWQVANGDF